MEHPFRHRPYRPNFAVVISAGILFFIGIFIAIQFRKETKVTAAPPITETPPPVAPAPEAQPANQEPGTPIDMSQ